MLGIQTNANMDLLLSNAFSYFGNDKNQWSYTVGQTFGSTWTEVLIVTALYLLIVFGGKLLMKNRKPFVLKRFTLLHNISLSIGSGILLLLFAEQIIPSLASHGLFWSVCNRDAWTQKLELLYYINYLIKWYEFVDTILLVLKKKSTPFLHVYHHSMTMILCFTQLNGTTSVSWVPVTINLFVHVIMYYYYYLTALGIRVFWKKLVTVTQIAQFVIDLGFVYFCSYNLFVNRYNINLPSVGPCRGADSAAIFGCFMLSSYLFLFIKFFFDTYNAKKSSGAKQKSQ